MKNLIIALLFLPFIVNAQSDDEGIVDNQEKIVNLNQLLEVKVGHSSDDCNGQGEPMIAFDELIEMHLPCQGFGDACTYKFEVEVILTTGDLAKALSSNNKYEVKIIFGEAYNEKEFIMPNRSIYCSDYKKYMNIPSITMKKDDTEWREFYKAIGVTFSDKPLYENN